MSRTHSAVWSARVAVIAAGFALCLSSPAMAFNGPASGQAAGTGNGAIGVGSNQDISIGTSTTDNATKFLLVASSTGDTSSFVFKALDSSQNPLLIIRNDGSVGIGTASLGTGLLDVGGSIYSTGNFTGDIGAANVTAGEFGANAGGGNYSFSGSVGIGTASPQATFQLVESTNPGAIIDSGPGAALRIRADGAARYRSDFGISSGGLTINSFDDGSQVYLPIYLGGSTFQLIASNASGTSSDYTFTSPTTGGAPG